MTERIDRRTFVRRAAALATILPMAVDGKHRGATLEAAPSVTLRVGFAAVASDASDAPIQPHRPAFDAQALRLGVELGIDEAKHAATLFGGEVILFPFAPTAIGTTPISAVILGVDDVDAASAAMRRAADRGIACLNTACSSDTLRAKACNASLFHVVPSDAMYRDALRQAKAPAGAFAAAWDPSLVRFGADTLNARFQARFGRPMTSDTWCGWVAVKMLWESALRARSAESRALIGYLGADTTQFDGHKGRPLSFRAWDHQLRQPVYVLRRDDRASATRVVAEAPASANPDAPSRDLLDQLGTARAVSVCRLAQ